LNGAFVLQQALAIGKEVVANNHRSYKEWITLLYQRALGRAATAKEIERVSSFITQYAAAYHPSAAPVKTVALVKKVNPGEGEAGVAANPDDIERGGETDKQERIEADNPKVAAWSAFAQALFASAEFRFVR
jgi:hypothetical protein